MVEVLFIGRTHIVVADAQAKLDFLNLVIHTGTNLDDTRAVLDQTADDGKVIDHVFMGAGIEVEKRLDIAREVITRSKRTTVHLKESVTGPEGFLPFVSGVLKGTYSS